jgi:hypothetical protein
VGTFIADGEDLLAAAEEGHVEAIHQHQLDAAVWEGRQG